MTGTIPGLRVNKIFQTPLKMQVLQMKDLRVAWEYLSIDFYESV